MAQTVQQQWEEFSAHVMPQGASYTQRSEMKKAFFAGFFSALTTCMQLGEESVSLDAGAFNLEMLRNECETFIRSQCK